MPPVPVGRSECRPAEAGRLPSASPSHQPLEHEPHDEPRAAVLELDDHRRPSSTRRTDDDPRPEQGCEERPGRPELAAIDDAGSVRSDAGSARGLAIVAQWVARTKPRGPTSADALAELAATLRRNAAPRCTACDGAGGEYRKRATEPTDVGSSWAPERRTKFGDWHVCDDCGGSGEGPG